MTDESAAEEGYRRLRAAVHSGDAGRIMNPLSVDWPGESFQLAGEGLLVAIAEYWNVIRPLIEVHEHGRGDVQRFASEMVIWRYGTGENHLGDRRRSDSPGQGSGSQDG